MRYSLLHTRVNQLFCRMAKNLVHTKSSICCTVNVAMYTGKEHRSFRLPQYATQNHFGRLYCLWNINLSEYYGLRRIPGRLASIYLTVAMLKC